MVPVTLTWVTKNYLSILAHFELDTSFPCPQTEDIDDLVAENREVLCTILYLTHLLGRVALSEFRRDV